MLEYREFPVRTALTYILFSPSVAFAILVIVKVIEGSLLPLTLQKGYPDVPKRFDTWYYWLAGVDDWIPE
jgi:hypothetical protein